MQTALRVMSFNIRNGRARDRANRWCKRRELVFDVIRRQSPHVLGAQEVHPSQLDELLEALPQYGAIAHRRYGGIFGTYAAILFDRERFESEQNGDFWLSPDPDGRRSKGWDAAAVRLCTWAVLADREGAAEPFIVFNSHFDQRGGGARRESARLIAARWEAWSHLPRVLTVDLNANESSEPLAILQNAGLRDAFREVRPDEAPAFTYHRFRGTRSRGVPGKIDFVLCDEKWSVMGAEVVRDESNGRLPSDHFPVTAELAVPR